MNKYVLIYMIQIAVALNIFFVAVRKYYESDKKERIHLLPLWLSANLFFWLLCNTMIQLIHNDRWIVFFHDVKYISVTTVPIIFFIIAFENLKREPLKRWVTIALLVVPVFTLFSIVTTESLQLFRSGVEVVKVSGVNMVDDVDEIAYWIHTAYSYAILGAGLVALMIGYFKEATIYRRKGLVILLSVWLPIISNIIYNFGQEKFKLLVDITPFTFFITLMGIYFALYIYKPIKVIPMARNRIVEDMRTAELFLDLDGRIFDMNKQFERLIETNRKVVFLEPLSQMQGLVYDAIRKKIRDQKEDVQLTLTLEGERTHWVVNVADVMDKKERSMGTLITLIDISEMQNMLIRMEEMSYEDPMTHVYNRKYFDEMIHTLDHPHYYPLGLLIGDINGLKYVNDSSGHMAGDEFLKEMAELIIEVTPSRSIVCRIGGDEFAVLIPNTSEEEIEEIIENVEYKCYGKKIGNVPVGIAVGSVVKQFNDMTADELIKRADEDMYRKKLIMGSSSRDNNLKLLTMILTEKSGETQEHLDRTAYLSRCFSEKLGLNPYQTNDLNLLSQLHDIGKVMIPDGILNKPGKLTDEEWQIMRLHPQKGYEILSNSPNLSSIADAALYHHERWDGKGYPRGFKGEDIPLLARVISIVDAYDVMTHKRVYKTAMAVDDALEELKRCSGTQFDPRLVSYFTEMILEMEKESKIRYKIIR